MNTRDDGGPAFPVSRRKTENYMDQGGYGRTRTVTVDEGGMTLRDYFAAHCPAPTNDSLTWAQEAEMRYAYADAMLAARAKS